MAHSKKKLIFATGVAFVSVFILCAGPLFSAIARIQIKKTLPGSFVSIGTVSVRPRYVAFSDVNISRDKRYTFEFGEIRFAFDFFSLLERTISLVEVKNAIINIEASSDSIKTFLPDFRVKTSGGGFIIDSIDISQARCYIRTSDVFSDFDLSLNISPFKRRINSLRMEMDALRTPVFEISGVYVDTEEAVVRVGELIHKKRPLFKDIKGKIYLKKEIVSLESLSGSLWGGRVSADAKIKIDTPPVYLINAIAEDIGIENIGSHFNLRDKFIMSGKMNAAIGIKSEGSKMSFFNADVSVSEPGGTLTITDVKFLKNMAVESRNSLKIIQESFKDYRYRVGEAVVFLENGSMILDVALDGQQGRRDLKVVFHDFNLRDLFK